MIELVVFDLAGTTIQDDGQVAAAFTTALKNHGIEITSEDLNQVRGATKLEAIRRFAPDQAKQIHASFCKKLAALYKTNGVQEIPGATETFRRLKQNGIRIALNTGFDQIITELIVDAAGWDRTLFSAVVCGDAVSRGRPAPDLIFRAMETCGITDARRVTNIGDTVNDLQAGHAATVLYNIGVLSGAHTREQMEREPHTHIIPSVAQLPEL